MSINDILNYNLDELNQAFDHVDDIKYPRRAEELYLRIKKLQIKENIHTNKSKNLEKNKTKRGYFIGFRFLYYFFLACLFRINPLLVSFLENQEQELEDKIDRIKDRLSRSIE